MIVASEMMKKLLLCEEKILELSIEEGAER
jgi:hypothetical protein